MGNIETLSSGTLNFIKELNQDQLETVRGADVHQYLTSLSNGVMLLKKNISNNIQGYFPDLWSAVNDIEEDIYQKIFGITYLKSAFDNLNITELQRRITKMEATTKTLKKHM